MSKAGRRRALTAAIAGADGEAGGATWPRRLDQRHGGHAIFADDLPPGEEQPRFGAFVFRARIKGEGRDDARAGADAHQAGVEFFQPALGFNETAFSASPPLADGRTGGMGAAAGRIFEVTARGRLIEGFEDRQRIEFRDFELIRDEALVAGASFRLRQKVGFI